MRARARCDSQLEQLHLKLEADLVAARDSVSDGSTLQLAGLVASAFEPLIPFFIMYATYCGKFTEAPAKLQEARRKRSVDSLVAQQSQACGTTLEAFLFRPVQRMCVYPLLFNQALKRMPAADATLAAARTSFEHCFEAISSTITQVNENVREQEAGARTREVFMHEVDGVTHLMRPGIKLEAEHEVRVKRKDSWAAKLKLAKRKACTLYIFTDIVLLVRKRKANVLFIEEVDVARSCADADDTEYVPTPRPGAQAGSGVTTQVGGEGSISSSGGGGGGSSSSSSAPTGGHSGRSGREGPHGSETPGAGAAGEDAGGSENGALQMSPVQRRKLDTVAEGEDDAEGDGSGTPNGDALDGDGRAGGSGGTVAVGAHTSASAASVDQSGRSSAARLQSSAVRAHAFRGYSLVYKPHASRPGHSSHRSFALPSPRASGPHVLSLAVFPLATRPPIHWTRRAAE